MIVNIISEFNILDSIGKGIFFAGGVGRSIENTIKIFQKSGIKYRINSTGLDYDILDVHTIGPFALYLINKAKKNGKKIVIRAHVTSEEMMGDTVLPGRIERTFSKSYLKKYYSLADVLVSPSAYTMDKLKQVYGLKNKIEVISNGIDLDKFSFSKEKRENYRKKFSLNKFTVFSVGHAIKRKGIRSFVRVGRILKDMDFIWYGERHIESMVELDDLPENMKFPGKVSNITAAYSSGDVLFFPTMNETQGLVLLEGAACKRPIVTRDLPVFEEFKDRKHCLKANDNNSFVKCIEELYESPALRKTLSENAYALVLTNHSLNVVGKKFLNLFKSLA